MRSCGERLEQSADDSDSNSTDSEEEELQKIGNVEWCKCGRCKPMFTYNESLWCQDTNEVPEGLFESFDFAIYNAFSFNFLSYYILLLLLFLLSLYTFSFIKPF